MGSSALDRLSPAVVDALVAVAGPGSGSTLLSVELRHLGGALARKQPGVLSHLDGGYLLFAVGMASSDPERAVVYEQLDRVRAAAATCATGAEYLNFGDEPGQAARSFPPATLDTLARCRAVTDPAGVMRTS